MKKKKSTENVFGNQQIGKDEKPDVKPEDHIAELGAGRQIGDPLSGTLSNRAGDESFDDDTRLNIKNQVSEDDDDM
ncbi:MAG: hypothetical protein IR153_11035 [Flavobacterium sp.]|nr:hypothetical protein [Flavobacterium sp.]